MIQAGHLAVRLIRWQTQDFVQAGLDHQSSTPVENKGIYSQYVHAQRANCIEEHAQSSTNTASGHAHQARKKLEVHAQALVQPAV